MTELTGRVFRHRRTEVVHTMVGRAVRSFAKKDDKKYVVYTLRGDETWYLMSHEQFFNGDFEELS